MTVITGARAECPFPGAVANDAHTLSGGRYAHLTYSGELGEWTALLSIRSGSTVAVCVYAYGLDEDYLQECLNAGHFGTAEALWAEACAHSYTHNQVPPSQRESERTTT